MYYVCTGRKYVYNPETNGFDTHDTVLYAGPDEDEAKRIAHAEFPRYAAAQVTGLGGVVLLRLLPRKASDPNVRPERYDWTGLEPLYEATIAAKRRPH